MPTQKPHSSSHSLKDLILLGSFVKFALGVTAAIVMHQRSGPVHNAMNDTLWAIAVIVVAQGFLGSVASWFDSRKQGERLHEMLEKRDARWATGNTQSSITGPVGVVAAGNGHNGQADTDQSVFAPNLPATTTTNTNTPSPTLIPSTCSSTSLPALDKSLAYSQAENSGQDEVSIGNTGINDVKGETQQLTQALTQENISRYVVLSSTDLQSSTFSAAPGVSVLANAKGTNEGSVTMNPAATDKSDERMDTQGNQSSFTEGTGLVSPGSGPNPVAVRDHSQYNEETGIGQCVTITRNNILTSATPPILVASSTLYNATSSSLPFQAEDLEVNQGMHPTTGGDEGGVQEHREVDPGSDYVAVGQYKEQIVVIHDSLLMGNVRPSTASWTFPLLAGEAIEVEKKEHVEVTPHTGSAMAKDDSEYNIHPEELWRNHRK